MSDYQTFRTRKDAQAEIAKMMGWDAKAVKIVQYDENNGRADVWVVQCNKGKNNALYLRTDGYVR